MGRAARPSCSRRPPGSLTYDLGRSAPVSAFRSRRDANDTYKIFGARSTAGRQLQAAGRDRQRRRRRTRPAHAPRRRSRRRWSASCASASPSATTPSRSPSFRPTAGRRRRSRPPQGHRRAGRQGRRAGVLDLRVVGQRRELARSRWRSRWAALALLGWGLWLRQEGRAQTSSASCAIALLMVAGRAVVRAYFNFGSSTSATTSTSGTRSTTTSARSTSKSCRTTASTSASRSPTPRTGAAPPGRAAQDHEPAHEHDGDDRGHPGPPRSLQGALHARSAGRTSSRTSPSSATHHDAKRWEDAADRPRLQRHAGLEHRRHAAGQPRRRPATASSTSWPCSTRSTSSASSLIIWWAFGWRRPVRRAAGVRHQLPLALLLDGRLVPALGLAVLPRGGDLPGEEGSPAARRASSATRRCCASSPCSSSWAAIAGALGARRPAGASAIAAGARPGGSRSPWDSWRRSSRASIAATSASSGARRWRSRSWSRSAW